MKAYVDGMRTLLYYTGMLFDKAGVAEDKEEKAKYQGSLNFNSDFKGILHGSFF